jgi:hypothetical protein
MAHDIFISYAKEDREVATKVSRALRDAGYKTWIAPDSIPPGKGYAGAIAEAIATAPVMVLVHSEHSNKSEHILNEVNLARNTGRPTSLIPFRIANIDYNADLQYYLARTQWVEAWTSPVEAHLQTLVNWVREIHPPAVVGTGAPQPPEPQEERDPTPLPLGTDKSAGADVATHVKGQTGDGTGGLPLKWLAVGAGALLLLLVAVVAINYKASGGVNENGNGGEEVAVATPTPTSSVPTPSPTPAATPPSTPTPTPPPATPTPAASPRPTPSRNINLRLPINSVVRPAPVQVPDSVIQQHVDKRIAGHAQDLSNVQGQVSDGVVTLTGSVHTADWKTTVEMQIRGITGVKKVVNLIRVQ